MDTEETPVWEACKENVKPFKEGRSVKSLNAALVQHSKSKDNERKMREYKRRLKNQDSDDPLCSWQSYIDWLLETYPDDSKHKHLLAAYKQCARRFQDDERYKDDERYLRIWLFYVEGERDPGDLLHFMHSKGIGTGRTEFYRAWAEYLECRGDSKSADEVYRLGIARAAQPLDKLQTLHSAFQLRLAERVAKGVDDDGPLTHADENQRTALGTLVGASRMPLAPRGGGSLPVDLHASKPDNIATTVFSVSDDESENEGEVGGPERNTWRSLPDTVYKENKMAAGPWNAPGRPLVGERRVLQPMAAHEFSVYEDNEDGLEVPAAPLKDESGKSATSSTIDVQPENKNVSKTCVAAAPVTVKRSVASQYTIPGPRKNERLVGTLEMFQDKAVSIDEIRSNHVRYIYVKQSKPAASQSQHTHQLHNQDVNSAKKNESTPSISLQPESAEVIQAHVMTANQSEQGKRSLEEISVEQSPSKKLEKKVRLEDSQLVKSQSSVDIDTTAVNDKANEGVSREGLKVDDDQCSVEVEEGNENYEPRDSSRAKSTAEQIYSVECVQPRAALQDMAVEIIGNPEPFNVDYVDETPTESLPERPEEDDFNPAQLYCDSPTESDEVNCLQADIPDKENSFAGESILQLNFISGSEANSCLSPIPEAEREESSCDELV